MLGVILAFIGGGMFLFGVLAFAVANRTRQECACATTPAQTTKKAGGAKFIIIEPETDEEIAREEYVKEKAKVVETIPMAELYD